MLEKDSSLEPPQFFYLRAFLVEGEASVLLMLPWSLYPTLSQALAHAQHPYSAFVATDSSWNLGFLSLESIAK